MTTFFTCPCCNSQIPAPPDVASLEYLATGVKGAVLRQLIATYPRGGGHDRGAYRLTPLP